MARGDTATAQTPQDMTGVPDSTDGAEPATAPSDNGSTPATDGTAPAKAKAKRQNRNTKTMPLTLPKELHALITEKAKEENTTGAGIAKKLLAGYVNYTLPLAVRAAKRTFASKEDRAKFQKDRNQKAKALLAALDSGEISPEILAKFIAAQNGSAVVTATADGNVEVAAGEGVPA